MQSWFQIVVCVCMLASLILSVCLGNPVQSSLREEERQEMAALAARMLRVILSDAGSYYTPEKRNAGTVDSLYNLPDLLGVGKR